MRGVGAEMERLFSSFATVNRITRIQKIIFFSPQHVSLRSQFFSEIFDKERARYSGVSTYHHGSHPHSRASSCTLSCSPTAFWHMPHRLYSWDYVGLSLQITKRTSSFAS